MWLPMIQLHSNNTRRDFSRKPPKNVKRGTTKNFRALEVVMNLNPSINSGRFGPPLKTKINSIPTYKKDRYQTGYLTVKKILALPDIKKHIRGRKLLDPCSSDGKVNEHLKSLGHEVVNFKGNW